MQNQQKQLPLLAANMVRTRFGIKLNWISMTEPYNSLHAASSLCPTSSTILVGVGRWAISQKPMTRCFQLLSDLESVQVRVTMEYTVYQERPEHDAQNVVMYYFVERFLLTGVQDRVQPPDIRCQKCTYMCSKYC